MTAARNLVGRESAARVQISDPPPNAASAAREAAKYDALRLLYFLLKTDDFVQNYDIISFQR